MLQIFVPLSGTDGVVVDMILSYQKVQSGRDFVKRVMMVDTCELCNLQVRWYYKENTLIRR